MLNYQANDERLVITAQEVAAHDVVRVDAAGVDVTRPQPAPAGKVQWWSYVAGVLLTPALPLLCIAACVTLTALRKKPDLRGIWTNFFCRFLIASGLLTSAAFGYLWSLKQGAGDPEEQLPLGMVSLDVVKSFPGFPAQIPLTGVELAAQTKPLVFIVTPEPGKSFSRESLEYAPIGAAFLIMADDRGYLLGTNRHVADASGLFGKRSSRRVLAISSEGSYAFADIVARHRRLDLALLWVERHGGHADFRQPIEPYADIAVGSSVFVIGHPERLFFTLSSGLVSRLAAEGGIQLSAPISPGNSGGPVYDSSGTLLAVVTSTVDKQINPNAENLNFAIRADALLSSEGWDFQGDGGSILNRFIQSAGAPR